MPKLLAAFRSHDIPWMARPSYRAEMRHIWLWGLFANLVDGSFSSIVVAKTFNAPELVPAVWATPMLAHLLSLLWGAVLRGRGRIRVFMVLAIGAVLSAGSIALTPSDWGFAGGALFTLQIAVARIFISGLVNVRSSIWSANYPRSHRARIAARIQVINTLLLLLVGAGASTLFDEHPDYYRYVYPLLAAAGVIALLPLRGLHIRGERAERLALQRLAGDDASNWARLRANLKDALSILRRDRAFGRYCAAQYLLGSANFMTDPVLSLFLTQVLALNYFHSLLVLEQVPSALAVATIPLWARYYDRVGILRFRVVTTMVWIASIALAALALAANSLGLGAAAAVTLLVLARSLTGVGRGAGVLGWNLGHLHFAKARDADLYMGIHMALTGFRGLIMPFVGVYAFSLVGPWALAIGVALATASCIAFARLARAEADAQRVEDLATPAASGAQA